MTVKARSMRALSSVTLLSFVFLSFVFLMPAAARAHPAIGIVRDRDGNIFYSDIARVWRINPQGVKSIVVDNVHTHELWLDAEDNLYGEHLWYEGDATHKWGHRVWKLARNGTLSDLIPARSGFREDYRDFFFARDRNGVMYWVERGPPVETDRPVNIHKRAPGGPDQILAQISLHQAGWLSAMPDGEVLVADGPALYRINATGRVHLVSASLSESQERHAIMGAWKDDPGNIYVAVYGSSAVKKIDAAGHVSTVATSASSWAPTGGLSAPDGSLWILENSKSNVQRVRHVEPGGKEKIF